MYESGENYLETILVLSKKNSAVRSIDIARELNFSKPSVSRAMGILRESGHIEVDPSGNIVLTKLGLEKASSVYERHQTLTQFLQLTTGVTAEIVETDACKMEHIISEEVFQGIKRFIKENKSTEKE